MNLQQQAQDEKERRTRSKLEAHREAIFTLRRKHWSYRQIAQWLKEHGVTVSAPSVFRFCERSLARRPRAGSSATTATKEQPAFIPTLQPQPNQPTQVKRPRFNTDIYEGS